MQKYIGQRGRQRRVVRKRQAVGRCFTADVVCMAWKRSVSAPSADFLYLLSGEWPQQFVRQNERVSNLICRMRRNADEKNTEYSKGNEKGSYVTQDHSDYNLERIDKQLLLKQTFSQGRLSQG